MKNRGLCRLRLLPRWLRLLTGTLLAVLGLPLFLSPLPGGLVLLALGGLMIFCTFPGMRSRLLNRLPRRSHLRGHLQRLMAACDRCSGGGLIAGGRTPT